MTGAATVADLARLLRTLRRRQARRLQQPELTYRELAAQAGWSHAMVAAYLTGKTLPSTDRFDMLIQLLGATPAEQGALATARDRVEESRRIRDPAKPRQLPAAGHGFTGRVAYLKELDELLPGSTADPTLVVITGPAGVGKTGLAVHWGHRVRDHFPDGELYLDLRGFTRTDPVRPLEALAQFLRTIGVPPDQIPADLADAAARYRSELAGRQMLVVLDNAATADQVRSLLPGSPGCLVVVTSRDRLSGLVARDGARRVGLDVLDLDESRRLLERILGPERVVAEAAAAADLARACSGLPLALRIAAATLINRPGRRLAAQVAALRADGGLATLDIEGDEATSVRRAFDLSYQAANPDGQRLFRLLGLLPGPDASVQAAAAAAELPVPRAEQLLDQLAGAHLMYEGAPGRYAYHDLLRQYAVECAHREEPGAVRDAALERWYGWCLSTADAAAKVLYPHRLRLPVPPAGTSSTVEFRDHVDALAWLDAERANLLAAITHAAAAGARSTTWLLADTLRSYFWMRMYAVDWSRAATTALAAAEAAGDLRAQAAAGFSLGDVNARLNRNADAITHYTQVLELSQQAGWTEGEAAVQIVLGTTYRSLGRLTESLDCLERALELNRERSARYGEAVTLGCLGRLHYDAGRLADAHAANRRALELHRELGSPLGNAVALNLLGQTYLAQEQQPDAASAFTEALALARQLGDRGTEVVALRGLAAVDRDAGRSEAAIGLAGEALTLARQMGEDVSVAAALHLLATIHHRLGRYPEAVAHHQQALVLTEASGDRYPQVEALIGLAAAARGLGELDAARDHAERARVMARSAGYRLLEQRAEAELGAAGR